MNVSKLPNSVLLPTWTIQMFLPLTYQSLSANRSGASFQILSVAVLLDPLLEPVVVGVGLLGQPLRPLVGEDADIALLRLGGRTLGHRVHDLPEQPEALGADVADVEQREVGVVVGRGAAFDDPVEPGLREPRVRARLGQEVLDVVELREHDHRAAVLQRCAAAPSSRSTSRGRRRARVERVGVLQGSFLATTAPIPPPIAPSGPRPTQAAHQRRRPANAARSEMSMPAEAGGDEDVDRAVERGLLDAALEVELAVAEVLDARQHRAGRAVGHDVGARAGRTLEDHRQVVGGLLVDLVGGPRR